MVTKIVNLDTWSKNQITVYVNQGEVNSRFLEVHFKNQGSTFDLANKTVLIYITKPDDNLIFNNCTILNSNNGTVQVALTSQMSNVSGILRCEFQIVGTNNEVLKVEGLKIVVMNCKDFSSAVESTSEFGTLVQSLNRLDVIVNKFNSLGLSEGTSIDADFLNGLTSQSFATATQGQKADSAIQGISGNGTTISPNENHIINLTSTNIGAFPNYLSATNQTNYDLLVDTGIYKVIQGTEILPSDVNSNNYKDYYIMVMNDTQNSVIRQLVMTMEDDNKLFTRIKKLGVWSQWQSIGSTSSGVTSYQDLGVNTIQYGGTGASTASQALSNLGIAIESGTWSPRLSSSTGQAPLYTTYSSTGKYYCIANIVYIMFKLRVLIKDKDSSVGTACITGLPYVGANLSSAYLGQTLSMQTCYGLSYSPGAIGYIPSNKSQINLKSLDGQNDQQYVLGDTADAFGYYSKDAEFIFSGFYLK